MFERDEVFQELNGRLVAAGINPLDPKVQAICEVVNAFYAERTREVLEKMQAVLAKIPTGGSAWSNQSSFRCETHSAASMRLPLPRSRARRASTGFKNAPV